MRKRVYKDIIRGAGVHRLKHNGIGNDRRQDKLEFNGPTWLRRYTRQYG